VSFTIAFLPNVGPLEVAIVLVILLVIFGPKRIPAAFRSIGAAVRGFRDTVGGEEEQEKRTAALEKPSADEAGQPGSDRTASGSDDRNKTKTDA
jgi:sec-independent protein translocase protein TatA